MVLAGAAYAFTTVTVGYPFDTVKTKMQTTYKGQGLMKCLRLILKNGGVLRLYRGSFFPYITIVTKRAVQYDLFERLLRKKSKQKRKMRGFVGGVLVGGAGTFFSCPMQNIKVRMQSGVKSKSGHIYKNSIDCARHLWADRGFFGFYRGFVINIIKDSCFAGMYLGTYALLREEIVPKTHAGYFFAGGFASTITWATLFPIDTLKSQMQCTEIDRSIWGTAKYLWRCGRIRALWSGTTPAILRIFPISASSMVVYELVRKWENSLGWVTDENPAKK